MVTTIEVYRCHCRKCGHKWQSRTERIPVECPKCKCRNWDRLPVKRGGVLASIA